MSTIVIAGAHGKIALQLGRLLTARGDQIRGIIRNPDHAAELAADGIEPIEFDLEHSDPSGLDPILDGADAVVFAAGAGPGSGDARKATMDRDGAVKLIDVSKRTGVRRYVIVSAMGARDPELEGDGFAAYLRAKAQADRALAASGLDYTIVRPGGLTDDPGTGRIRVGDQLDRGSIPRADVAATLLAVLDHPATAGIDFDLVSGEDLIADALAGITASDR